MARSSAFRRLLAVVLSTAVVHSGLGPEACRALAQTRGSEAAAAPALIVPSLSVPSGPVPFKAELERFLAAPPAAGLERWRELSRLTGDPNLRIALGALSRPEFIDPRRGAALRERLGRRLGAENVDVLSAAAVRLRAAARAEPALAAALEKVGREASGLADPALAAAALDRVYGEANRAPGIVVVPEGSAPRRRASITPRAQPRAPTWEEAFEASLDADSERWVDRRAERDGKIRGAILGRDYLEAAFGPDGRLYAIKPREWDTGYRVDVWEPGSIKGEKPAETLELDTEAEYFGFGFDRRGSLVVRTNRLERYLYSDDGYPAVRGTISFVSFARGKDGRFGSGRRLAAEAAKASSTEIVWAGSRAVLRGGMVAEVGRQGRPDDDLLVVREGLAPAARRLLGIIGPPPDKAARAVAALESVLDEAPILLEWLDWIADRERAVLARALDGLADPATRRRAAVFARATLGSPVREAFLASIRGSSELAALDYDALYDRWRRSTAPPSRAWRVAALTREPFGAAASVLRRARRTVHGVLDRMLGRLEPRSWRGEVAATLVVAASGAVVTAASFGSLAWLAASFPAAGAGFACLLLLDAAAGAPHDLGLRRIELFSGGDSVYRGLPEKAEALLKRPLPLDVLLETPPTYRRTEPRRFGSLDEALAAAGAGPIEFERALGRTLIFRAAGGSRVAVKIQKQGEADREKLERELSNLDWLAVNRERLGLRGRFPRPLARVFEFPAASLPEPVASELQARRADAAAVGKPFISDLTDGRYRAVAYVVDEPGYFAYLHDGSLSEEDFEAATRVNLHDLGALARRGIVHASIADLFHNVDHADGREDRGAYLWMVDLLRDMGDRGGTGRLHAWPRAVEWTNMRLSGPGDVGWLAALEDVASRGVHLSLAGRRYAEHETWGLHLASHLGDYLLAWTLAYVRRLQSTAEGRRLLSDWRNDAAARTIGENIRAAFEELWTAYAGGARERIRAELATLVDWERLGRQIIFFMGEKDGQAHYYPWIEGPGFPRSIFGPDVDVRLPRHTLKDPRGRRDPWREWRDGAGWRMDPGAPDLGPVNGPNPLSELVVALYRVTPRIVATGPRAAASGLRRAVRFVAAATGVAAFLAAVLVAAFFVALSLLLASS